MEKKREQIFFRCCIGYFFRQTATLTFSHYKIILKQGSRFSGCPLIILKLYLLNRKVQSFLLLYP